MHTFWLRLNAVLTFAGTVLAVLCALISLTDYFHQSNPQIDVELVSFDGLQREYGNDRAWLTLNVKADLRSLFSWNTKQLFLSIEVDFETRKHPINQMVIWSHIFKDKEEALVDMPTLRPVYPFQLTDNGTNLKGKAFNVTLKWNVMPIVGSLQWHSQTFSGFQFPDEYVKPAVRTGRHDMRY